MLCKTCHSEIGSGSLDPSQRIQGIQGTDVEGNPIPRWSNDPVLTKGGFSGDDFTGISRATFGANFREIQELRNQQEVEAGLPETEFSPIEPGTHISVRHFTELRESTERILNVVGLSLQEYFSLDAQGVTQPQNPRLEQFGVPNPQIEWVDVSRGQPYVNKDGELVSTFTLPDSTIVPSPTLPARTKIRAIHFEDLRHPIANLRSEALLIQEPTGAVDIRIYFGTKTGAATFEDLTTCHEE